MQRVAVIGALLLLVGVGCGAHQGGTQAHPARVGTQDARAAVPASVGQDAGAGTVAAQSPVEAGSQPLAAPLRPGSGGAGTGVLHPLFPVNPQNPAGAAVSGCSSGGRPSPLCPVP